MARVLVGMSGGVDSAVAAYLLQQAGHEVIGATMRLWVAQDELEPVTGGCCALTAVEDARQVAMKLGIPHYVLNYREVFRACVVEPFISEYQAGQTPNPCIACNSRVRFTHFLQQARSLGCDFIATGHYAQIERQSGGLRLKKAVDRRKDQTYMLFRMTEAELSSTLFPLGGLEKSEVRRIASRLNLSVANKPDSQEICFVPDNDYRSFLRHAGVRDAPGSIIDESGSILGTHTGIFNYTVGQRKGLGLTSPAPLYVLTLDAEKNHVVVGESDRLMRREVVIADLHFLEVPSPATTLMGKVRYSAQDTPCTLAVIGAAQAVIRFVEPVRGPTPGQSLVLYCGDYVVGGGRIMGQPVSLNGERGVNDEADAMPDV
ncbi:MAG: tRNA-specific 2-thiouridylase MnmA [Firmicutes bacterium]|nr:tRNA-specific 2-thiouridylase MnmA [candidate division NPL-UPA2 bacterium]